MVLIDVALIVMMVDGVGMVVTVSAIVLEANILVVGLVIMMIVGMWLRLIVPTLVVTLGLVLVTKGSMSAAVCADVTADRMVVLKMSYNKSLA